MNKSAKLVTTADAAIEWSSGENFNGYVICSLNYPTGRIIASLAAEFPLVQIPTEIVVPIKDGVYDENSRVLWTSAIDPPGVDYTPNYYDITGNFIAAGDDFTVADADTKTLNPPTLTAP